MANMSKESDSIIRAWQKGDSDRRIGKPYSNPFKKQSQREKFKAYRSGYNQ